MATHDALFSVNNTRYVARVSTNDVALDEEHDGSLVTVFDVRQDSTPQLSREWFHDALDRYRSGDDVFQDRFLAGVVLNGVENHTSTIDSSAQDYLHKMGMEWIKCLPRTSTGNALRPGPYILLGGRLREAWRLYNDEKGDFMASVKPADDGYQLLEYKSDVDANLAVAVPSRLKFSIGDHNAVKGLRFVVKDNLHVAGIKTTLGNKAYFNTFPVRTQTAASIQKLIDAGGVLIAKAKMNSLGTWEEPTEYIDYQAPWNSRADGYQGTGGSSTGSAAAMANYDWLDFALGSDTWGSVMRPALWSGTFGFRPTHDAVSREGLNPSIPSLDMPALLTRDLERCIHISSLWLDKEKLVPEIGPITAVKWASDFWGYIDQNQNDIAKSFVQDIEAHLGIKHTKISFAEEWARHPPPEADGKALDEYMVPASGWISYSSYHFTDDFRAKHIEKFGVPPYVSPPNRKNWESNKHITKEQYEEGLKRIEVYKQWFKTTIMEGKDANVMLVLPIENLLPRYRDEPPTFKRPPSGVNSLFLSPVLAAPEIVIPVGEVPYTSKITERVEKLPFAVGLMTAPGTDLHLLRTALEILQKSGRPTSVSTGRLMWPEQHPRIDTGRNADLANAETDLDAEGGAQRSPVHL